MPKKGLKEDTRAPDALMRCLAEGIAIIKFQDPDSFQELTFPCIMEAKIGLANELGRPLPKLFTENKMKIDKILSKTLTKKYVLRENKETLTSEKEIIVAKSVSLEKSGVSLKTLIVTLYIDKAHDSHGNNTLIGLKRFIEMVQDCGGVISVVLAGHPNTITPEISRGYVNLGKFI